MTVRKGAKGNLTKILQRALHAKGYGNLCGTIDGEFGSNTYNAVTAFQRSRGLVVDGLVGKKTWKALLA